MALLAIALACRYHGAAVTKIAKLTYIQQESFLSSSTKANREAVEINKHLATWDRFGIWLNDPIIHLPRIGELQSKKVANVGSASLTGERRQNEDRFSIAELANGLFCFAVFDGHGGSDAAEYCSRYIGRYIQHNLQTEVNLETVLMKSFLQIDSDFAQNSYDSGKGQLFTSGTTATVALLKEESLTVANVGDSQAILCHEGKADQLTHDHTPRRRDERKRIKECGGFIDWNCAGSPYVNGRLAMTRSIGDVDLKPYGVTAQPEVKTVELQRTKDCFLVLTTDGVSAIMDAQEVCDIVKKCQDPSEAATVVNEQALQYGTHDNVTTIVVPFGAWGKYSTSFTRSGFGRMMVASSRWH
ncbi:protein phosphatase 1K, mitochondrial-like [Amblyraja radiata]|uniref:protein phosphatase 1K, mitochondrial-like n=1 Tax=Amblyraja radiata TaxID=386614 RepID=UPI001403526D|nr:protein phosphatase 1K, mitochondrial-like [Amblyraja radiata]XP_032890134.1 protein phosphatase 1K, mitochondrial-like [Amblyraja radiata]